MALRTRLLLIVGLVMTAMLLLAGYVGHSAGERMRAALLQARAAHLLNTFRAHAEYRLALGLTLDQLDGLQLLLERARPLPTSPCPTHPIHARAQRQFPINNTKPIIGNCRTFAASAQ